MDVTISDRDGWRVPTIKTSPQVVVAQIVHACHETTIGLAAHALGAPELTGDMLDRVLTYCAERRCEADKATCPGCKLRTESRGLNTLEDFVAHHREIVVGDGRIRLTGRGETTLHTPALSELEKTWSGENYWFWARRVLRKLRHGVRRSQTTGSPYATAGATPVVILVEPQLADNIGMVARAMANFGLDALRLVNPRDGWPNDKARIAASGANYIIDGAQAFETLQESIADLNWISATTARQRDLRKPVLTPRQAVDEMRGRLAEGGRCGILFGRERSGLETGELANADAIVMVPVNSRFASLNLAQAVLLLGYEWLRDDPGATLGRVTTYERAVDPGLNLGHDSPAPKAALVGFFEHLEAELDRFGFFNPPHKRPNVVRNLRTMFTRMAPTEQEVRTLRGIVATLSHGKGKGRKTSP